MRRPFVLVIVLASAIAVAQQMPSPTDARREDLKYLASELPRRHLKAFHTVKKEAFEAAIAKLEKELPSLTDPEFQIRLAQIVTMIDDAHTTLGIDQTNHLFIPIAFTTFDDGTFIGGTDDGHAKLIGAKVEAIDGKRIDTVFRAVGSVIPAENPYWRRTMTPQWLSDLSMLRALRLARSDTSVKLTVRNADGKRETIEVASLKLVPDKPVITVLAWPVDKTPLRNQNRRKNYWIKVLPELKAVYFAYNRCREDPAEPFGPLVEQAMKAIDEGRAQRLIIDLRGNGGGDSMVANPLIKAIKDRPALNRKDRLFVLVGPRTFSSAMMNAQQLRTGTAATLLGEPTGGKPNSYGEVKFFDLPNSKLRVFYCTKYFRQIVDKDPDAVYPDVAVRLTSKDYFGGSDPVLERALSGT